MNLDLLSLRMYYFIILYVISSSSEREWVVCHFWPRTSIMDIMYCSIIFVRVTDQTNYNLLNPYRARFGMGGDSHVIFTSNKFLGFPLVSEVILWFVINGLLRDGQTAQRCCSGPGVIIQVSNLSQQRNQ